LLEAADSTDDELACALAEIFALPAVPMSIASDDRATRRYFRVMRAADAVEAGESLRAIAAELSISVKSLRRELRWLSEFNLPTWLRPSSVVLPHERE
jgi:hypothetical protein